MKLQIVLPALLVVIASSLPVASFGATDTDKAQTPLTQAEPAATKKMKPHSHMEEKLGMPLKAAAESSGADKTKHSHPRDGK